MRPSGEVQREHGRLIGGASCALMLCIALGSGLAVFLRRWTDQLGSVEFAVIVFGTIVVLVLGAIVVGRVEVRARRDPGRHGVIDSVIAVGVLLSCVAIGLASALVFVRVFRAIFG